MIDSTVHIENLYLAFDDTIIFDQFSLTLQANHCTCLLGPSGVGKSVLLNLLAGLSFPNSTAVQYTGEIICGDQQPLTSRIAWMSQSDLLFPWCSAIENVLSGARLRGTATPALQEKAHALFVKTGLSGKEHYFPHQLSGGMRQRVALIRTLLEDRPIILMDEPFSAVDAITRYELQILVTELFKERTVLFVTHDPSEALRIANSIYVLSGRPVTATAIKMPTTQPLRDFNDPLLISVQMELFHQLTAAKRQST
ncbi:MAG: ABC transporter ATP-binding protein [Gammaproteobacteria bacterium]|nr:ABC transporter ATP-binding protein [Gammaproteobacteria bacterium]